MTKHDYLHRFKEMNECLKAARVRCTQPAVLDEINKAKLVLWLVADDMGIDLLKGE